MDRLHAFLGVVIVGLIMMIVLLCSLANFSDPVVNVEYYFDSPSIDTVRNGFFSADEFFCVITKNRSSEEIASITFHELAHYFNFVDEEHFSQEWVI